MGFTASRADAEIWIRKNDQGTGYKYIATHVDDVNIVSKDPKVHMENIARHFPTKKGRRTPIIMFGQQPNSIRNSTNSTNLVIKIFRKD